MMQTFARFYLGKFCTPIAKRTLSSESDGGVWRSWNSGGSSQGYDDDESSVTADESVDRNRGDTVSNRRPRYERNDQSDRIPRYERNDATGSDRRPRYEQNHASERRPRYERNDQSERRPRYERNDDTRRDDFRQGRKPHYRSHNEFEDESEIRRPSYRSDDNQRRKPDYIKSRYGDSRKTRTTEALLTPDSEYELICGSHAVLAALRCRSRSGYGKLLLQEGKSDYDDVLKASKGFVGIHSGLYSKMQMDQTSSEHRGVILEAMPIDVINTVGDDRRWSRTSSTPPRVFLALDQIVDPNNLGAILRTACFMGIDGVLISQKNSAPLSAAVSRVSSGALEILHVNEKLLNVKGPMPTFLTTLAAKGFKIVGTSSEPVETGGFSLKGCKDDVIIVLGNEATGVRTTVKNACTDFVNIPNSAPEGMEDVLGSLNVSVACAVLLTQLKLS